jgi:glycerophosphoryl diester phosphodiesterase
VTTSTLLHTGHRPRRALGSRVQVIAHRGASAKAPENTLSAVRAAVACGADAVEIDVRRSLDGEFVVLHDATLGRTTDARTHRWHRSGPRVNELTLAQLRDLDAGSWKGESFVGERIPTLEEVLDLVASTRAHLLIEIKRPVGLDPRQLSDLVSLLAATSLPHRRITVQSFDARVVHDLRDKLPAVSLAVLTRHVPSNLGACSRWADQVSLHHKSLDRPTVDAVQGWGMHCVAWTVNNTVSMLRMLDLGVDGVITDHPDALLGMMTEHRSETEPAAGEASQSLPSC